VDDATELTVSAAESVARHHFHENLGVMECPRCGEGEWYRQVVAVDERVEERAVCRPCGALIVVLREMPAMQVFVHER